MNNKNKNNFNNIWQDIDFSEIGYNITRSINSTIKKFTKKTNKEKLPQTRNNQVCAQKPPDITKAKVYQVLSIFLGLGFLSSFVIFTDLFLDYRGIFYFLATIFSLILTFLGPYLSWRASKKYLGLSNRYVRYLNELGSNTVISIRDLASATAQSEEDTIRDLLYMMKNGYFYQARIVEDDSLFLLDIPTFKLYKEKRKEVPQRPHKPEDGQEMVEDLSYQRAAEIIREGQAIVENIEDTKTKIKDENFKTNIENVIKNSRDILRIVDNHPEKSYALNKFSDYYLPTVAKLTETYHEFELMRTDDPRITKSMADINESIKTIGDAFDKIKVELLGDRAMDIKTDIDTINLLLNQEGYTEDDWSNE